MLNQVVLLTTDWACDYWHRPKVAKYTKPVSYRDLHNWNDLAHSCPLAGLGIYKLGKKQDCSKTPFVYIKINGMTYDVGTGNPDFNFEVIQVASTNSDTLRNKLSAENKRLISSIESHALLRILNEMGEKQPNEWLQLAPGGPISTASPSWRDYLGNYFLALEQGTLSDNEVEDRIAFLLKALGFNVIPKGHRIQGAYADGIALYENIGVVYDCKNTQSFAPTEDDIRALKQYTNDEMILQTGRTLYSAFIAKDFQMLPRQGTFHLRMEQLLHLLAVKLKKGSDFNLNGFNLLLQRGRELNDQAIDDYWHP